MKLSDQALWDLVGIFSRVAKAAGYSLGQLKEVALFNQLKGNQAEVVDILESFHAFLHYHEVGVKGEAGKPLR